MTRTFLFSTSRQLIGACAISLLTVVSLSGCSDDTTSTPPTTTDSTTVTQVIDTVSYNVILGTYSDLKLKSEQLVAAIQTLQATPTAATLSAAQQAWRDARRPWEESEAFLFGPVETQGIDQGIDSWPVNKADLDNVLASNATLTKAYIDGLEGTLKGFHTIEYLLFGTNANKQIGDFTSRQFEYLNAVTQSFSASTSSLWKAWDPSGQNFVATLATAGSANATYPTTHDALQELINGMAGICDEVASSKISDAYKQQDRSLEESQFSNNSNSDFSDNIRSVQNIYLGGYNREGMGLSMILKAKDPALDTKVRAQLDSAINAIGEMLPTFGSAIFNNKPSVDRATEAVLALRITIDNDVRKALLQ